MSTATFPPEDFIKQNTVTEFVEVNGMRIPKHLYLKSLNRKQRRLFAVEIRKKHSNIKLVRVENNYEEPVEDAEIVTEPEE